MVNTKTLELTANVVSKINFDKKYPYIYIKNFGDTDVYATELDDITPDADGVTRISAGTVGLIYRECIIDDLYVMSSDNCKIEIIGAYDANLSFNKQIIIGGDEYDDTALRNAVNQKADKADVYTKNETDEKITSKVAEIVANAPEDFDTLKEMSDWIAGHENDAAAMNSAIQTNAGNISDLQTNKANVSDLDNYVEKSDGKGLSTNDYTTAEKNKLAGIATGANNYTLPTATASTLGGVKVGSGLSISNGVLSASGGSDLNIAVGHVESGASGTITLGFTPKFVIMVATSALHTNDSALYSYHIARLAVTDYPVSTSTSTTYLLRVVDNGFYYNANKAMNYVAIG